MPSASEVKTSACKCQCQCQCQCQGYWYSPQFDSHDTALCWKIISLEKVDNRVSPSSILPVFFALILTVIIHQGYIYFTYKSPVLQLAHRPPLWKWLSIGLSTVSEHTMEANFCAVNIFSSCVNHIINVHKVNTFLSLSVFENFNNFIGCFQCSFIAILNLI